MLNTFLTSLRRMLKPGIFTLKTASLRLSTRIFGIKNALVSNLESVFNRGFSSGFFMGKPVGDWTSKGNAAKSKNVFWGMC